MERFEKEKKKQGKLGGICVLETVEDKYLKFQENESPDLWNIYINLSGNAEMSEILTIC